MSKISNIDVQLAEAETALDMAFDPVQVSALANKIVELKAARTAAQAAAVTPGAIPVRPAQVAPAPAMSPAPAAPAPVTPVVEVVAPLAPPPVVKVVTPLPVHAYHMRPALRPTRN